MNEKVLIISAYGRGHSLAVRLQRAGIPVEIMEISDSLGVWIPEEIEGPFGFFQNEQLNTLQLESLVESDSLLPVDQGFSLWLKSGPLELQGPNISHRMKKMKISMDLNTNSFLGDLARYYAAKVDFLRREAFNHKPNLSIFSKFSIRMVTRQGFIKTIEWCRRNKVKVYEKTQIIDIIAQDRKNLRAIEFKLEDSKKTEIVEFGSLVWCLSSEETSLLSKKIQKILFPNGAIEPEWIWSRYRVKISEGVVRNQIPLHSIAITDIDQAWTHENFIILIRTGSADQFDAWMRLPANQRFNNNYLQQKGDLLIEALGIKLINQSVEIINYPVDHSKTFQEVGPSRHPIFTQKVLDNLKPASFDNIIFNSVEQCQGLGLNFYFTYQNEVFTKIESWWTKIQIKKNKKAKELSHD